MNKRERKRFIFILLSGALYYIMLLLIPTAIGAPGLIATISAPFTLIASIFVSGLYYFLIKKTVLVFITEIFTLLGIVIIIFTLFTFPFK